MEAAGGETHRLGGLGEQAAARLVRPRHFLQPLAVDLGVGPDALAFVASGLDGAGGGDPAADLGRSFGRRRQDEVGCESRKSASLGTASAGVPRRSG
jgi:hypothetical protein